MSFYTKMLTKEEIKNIVAPFEKQMQCTCDFDNWQPLHGTGHTTVCQIYNAALPKINDLAFERYEQKERC